MGLLSALGRRGLRSLEAGQMFGQRPMRLAEEIAQSEGDRYIKAQIPRQGIQMLKQKLASGQPLNETEVYYARMIPEYLSPQERQALEASMDALHAGGGQAYPVQSGMINAPSGQGGPGRFPAGF